MVSFTGAGSIVIALTLNFPGQAAVRNACGLFRFLYLIVATV
jgi:hypothetical protein